MAPKEAPAKPTTFEFLELMSGPRVELYVGPEKKFYSVPKKLLCHYSSFFDRAFNGAFKEGETQNMNLPEDGLGFFNMLLDYMLHRGIAGPPVIKASLPRDGLKVCMDFVAYTDHYDLGELSEAIYKPLKEFLKSWTDITQCTIPEFASCIELVFRVAPAKGRLRTLIAQAALASRGLGGLSDYKKQEEEVEGYAAAVLAQVRASRLGVTWNWTCPLTGYVKKY